MSIEEADVYRRHFLRSLMVASGAGLLGITPEAAVAEPPPEITSITMLYDPDIPILCYGPQYVAKEMLHLEGFTEVNFIPYGPDISDAKRVGAGEAHIGAGWAGDFLLQADLGTRVVALSGMHNGCTEIIAGRRVRSFRDLKGKKVAIYSVESAEYIWFNTMVAYIGLDPRKDIEWVVHPYEEWGELLETDEVDAIMLWPPAVQEFREKQIGHVVMSTTTDQPWRDYFCCMVFGNRDFIEQSPIATKRALRAILKATDLCAIDPEGAARTLVENGFEFGYDRAVEVFQELPYAQWREFDPADTLRFFALRMHETGFIQRTPDDIVTHDVDWRFLNELKRELKA